MRHRLLAHTPKVNRGQLPRVAPASHAIETCSNRGVEVPPQLPDDALPTAPGRRAALHLVVELPRG